MKALTRVKLIAVGLLVSSSVFAKVDNRFAFKYKPMDEKAPVATDFFLSQEKYNDLLSASTKVNLRNLASSLDDDSRMSSEFRTIRDAWNKIGFDQDGNPVASDKMYLEAEKLDLLLQKMRAEYDKYPTDAKLFAAVVLPMQTLKSVVWRSADVFNSARAIRQSLVEAVRSYYGSMKLFFPNSSWEVGFAYVTEPIKGTKEKFNNESEIQAFLANEYYKSILQSIEVVQALKISSESPLVWDNKIVMGQLSFPSGADRFIAVREPERLAILSVLHKQAYWVCLGSIYNVQNMVQLGAEVSALYGIELQKAAIAPMFFSVNAPTRKDRVKIVNSATFKTSFTKNIHGDSYANNAFGHLKSSVLYAHITWKMLKDAPNYENAFLDPALFKGDSSRTEKSFANLIGLLGDKPYAVQSMVDEKVVKVSLKNFFTHLPQDGKDLLPTKFSDDSKEFFSRDVDGKKLKFRNYKSGHVAGFSAPVYAELFPDLKADMANKSKPSEEKVIAYARTLNESRGAWAISDVLDFFWR